MFDLASEYASLARDLDLDWEALNGSHVVVTGATGLIGSLCVRTLLERNRAEQADITVHALVRDADKLDIYTVLDHAIETDYLPSHPDVYWGLPLDGPPSPKVVASLERGDSVDYADIQSFADFVFIQLAWCNGGLYYAASRRLALERGEVDIRRRYLHSLLPAHGAVIDRCCDIATAALAR